MSQSSPSCGQAVIAVTGTAVGLGSARFDSGVVVKAFSSNAGKVFVGPATVNTTDDGTGNGYALEPGEPISFGLIGNAGVFINGTAGDKVYWSAS